MDTGPERAANGGAPPDLHTTALTPYSTALAVVFSDRPLARTMHEQASDARNGVLQTALLLVAVASGSLYSLRPPAVAGEERGVNGTETRCQAWQLRAC